MIAHHRKVLSLGAIAAAFVVVAGAAYGHAYEPTRLDETARLRAHFDTVLGELRSADAAHLPSAQRAARAALIARLAEYASSGRFPHNHVVADRRVPVFRDEHGTLCAMAFLIASTGRTDIVEDISRRDNLARIPELARDARLGAWLDSTGLTLAEAARIQPAYDGCRMLGDCQPTADGAILPSRDFRTGSIVASVLSGASVVVNGFSSPATVKRARLQVMFGALAGVGQIALGSHAMIQGGEHRSLGYVNFGFGAAALATAVWRLSHPPQPRLVANSVSASPLLSGDGTVALVLSVRR